MQKVRVGICCEDKEYESRFTKCLMNHYRTQLELYIFSGPDQILANNNMMMEALIVSDMEKEVEQISLSVKIPVFYLYDKETEEIYNIYKDGIIFVDKYQEIKNIVDELLRGIQCEEKTVNCNGLVKGKTVVSAIYSLTETEYQIPFAMTMASILCERERVLLLDMQENSGLAQVIGRENDMNLEELLVMAEGGSYSINRMQACIGHLDRIDYIYPVMNSESICEVSPDSFSNLINMLRHELEYDRIIINLGARFQGFFQVLNGSTEIYFIQKNGTFCHWRDNEFFQEMEKNGFTNVQERLICVNLPSVDSTVTSCERLIEEWKWNEFGDMIRKVIPGVMTIG